MSKPIMKLADAKERMNEIRKHLEGEPSNGAMKCAGELPSRSSQYHQFDARIIDKHVQPLVDALDEVAAHAPPNDGISDPGGARWVGDGAILRVITALREWRNGR